MSHMGIGPLEKFCASEWFKIIASSNAIRTGLRYMLFRVIVRERYPGRGLVWWLFFLKSFFPLPITAPKN